MSKTYSTRPKDISVSAAMVCGLLYVNGPVSVLMFTPMIWCLAYFPWLSRTLGTEWYVFFAFCLVFLVGVACGWIWWAYAVPRWRLWAYERVRDIAKLKVRAVQVGLTWPDGHLFERTEFRSESNTLRQRELERLAKKPSPKRPRPWK